MSAVIVAMQISKYVQSDMCKSGNTDLHISDCTCYNNGYFHHKGLSMAGSIKWFVYTTDAGTDFALRLDESNTEAVNGGTQDLVTGLNIPNALPRNIKPREVYYTNQDRTRTIRCVCLTQTIYNGIVAGGVPTITDPIAGTGTLGLIRANGERIQLPVPLDTGLTDGDDT